MSMVMGAMRSPRSQARTRSRCHWILVPSRTRSVCSVSNSVTACVTPFLEPPDLVPVAHLFLVQVDGAFESFLEAALEGHHQERFLVGRQLDPELDGGARAPVESRADQVAQLQPVPDGQLVQARTDARHPLLLAQRRPRRRSLRLEAV